MVDTVPPPIGAPAARYFVSELGVAYPLAAEAVTRFGYPSTGVPNVPVELLDLLPKGPVLDSVETDENGKTRTGPVPTTSAPVPNSAGAGTTGK